MYIREREIIGISLSLSLSQGITIEMRAAELAIHRAELAVAAVTTIL